MVVTCCVVNCTNRFDKENPDKFYRIPKFPLERRNSWILAIKRADDWGGAWEPSEHHRVCSRHFITGKKSKDRMSPDYVPTVNMGHTTKSSRLDPLIRLGRHERRQNREAEKEKKEVEKEVATVLLDLSSVENRQEIESQPDEGVHDQCIRTIATLRMEARQLHDELWRLQDENRNLQSQVHNLNQENHLLESDKKVQFYTGIHSKALFMWILSFCASALPSCKKLTPSCVLLCTLMKLRLNLQHQDLAYRFGISISTVSDLLNQSLPGLAEKLSFLVQWPDRDILMQHMPAVIKASYPKCCSIIDCFEIFIQRPTHLTARAQTWSNYKHHNTIKFLVSITPTGAISFVSKAFGGRTSDKVITQRSGYLDNLQHGDQVLADRGFLIAEELAYHNATLVIPAFTKGKTQLSAKEVEKTRKLACVPIHVERAIERLKNFHILSGRMGMYLVPQADNIATICSALCNLQPKLVS